MATPTFPSFSKNEIFERELAHVKQELTNSQAIIALKEIEFFNQAQNN